MGTAPFAVPSLDLLLKNNFDIVAVVTAPDRPAGRGKKVRMSPIKEFAIKMGLNVLQPEKLKDPDFIDNITRLKPHIQVVVAFRMLPRAVWSIPEMGTINLHASLLPQYRGAAPINHALFHGDKVSGVSTFMIDEKIDTGNILKQRKTGIGESETAGELHDRLMIIGAELLQETIQELISGTSSPIPQDQFISNTESIRQAPKIFRDDCRIDWDKDADTIFNLIRGLSPVPAAFTSIVLDDGSKKNLKIIRAEKDFTVHNQKPGEIQYDRTNLKVACKNTYLLLTEVQVEGKKKMDIGDFLRGFPIEKVLKLA